MTEMWRYASAVARNNAAATENAKYKHYGWGIVDKNNRGANKADESKTHMLQVADMVNFGSEEELADRAPYRVVELFYKEEGE